MIENIDRDIPERGKVSFWRRGLRSRFIVYFFRALAVFACILTVSYQIENWRGRRAWGAYKKEAEKKGTELDWAKLVPPPVPDELNAFDAPVIKEWFAQNGTSKAVEGLRTEVLFAKASNTRIVAEVMVLSPRDAAPGDKPDVSLLYAPPLILPNEEDQTEATKLIPLMVMDDVPLEDAIRNLARQGEINFMIDPEVHSQWIPTRPHVSLRWENVTALHALLALLYNNGLELTTPVPVTSIVRIQRRNDNGSKACFLPQAREALLRAFQDWERKSQLAPSAQQLRAVSGEFVLFSDVRGAVSPKHGSPIKVLLRNDSRLSAHGVQSLLQGSGAFGALNQVRVSESESKVFRVYVSPGPFCGASEYLACTAGLEKDFNVIREGLKRPYSRGNAAYSPLIPFPVPNFVNVRIVSQILGQRAQAYLLMGEPERALREIRLIHDLCGLLENRPQNRPSGSPVLLVSAMIRVAVTGIYSRVVGEVACGLERHRQGRGRYPENLEELVPAFATEIPRDIISGELPRYRRTDREYQLYSVGWNQTDDGGCPGEETRLGGIDSSTGDWVWPGSSPQVSNLTAQK